MPRTVPPTMMSDQVHWVRPAPPKSLLLRNPPDKDDRPKQFIMFDEIFPAKKNIDSAEKGRKGYKEVDDTFHRAISPTLTIGQCFGILPVGGIQKPDTKHLRFSKFSWRFCHTIICMISSAFMTFACLMRMVYTGLDIYKTISMMFYGSTMMVLVLFLRLAPRWPALGAAMAQKERIRPGVLRSVRKRSLRTRFNICCWAILLPALSMHWDESIPSYIEYKAERGKLFSNVEHVFAIVNGISVAYDCRKNMSLAESYFQHSYEHVFLFTSYSPWKGAILQCINLESTFNWNFMDLFIIVMSLGLTDRFEQLNERLEAVKGKHLPEQFWKSAREEFAHTSRLVKEVDGSINEIVLLSFANNLYFICLQLFNSLKPLRGISHAIYFTFSFSFLMTRSLAVSLGAARINAASKKPATILYAAPSSSYCTELQRFLEQVVTDVVAITGLNFFYVTRGLVLTITGTIVTYELVLVQFNASPQPVSANVTINDSCGVPIRG